MLAIDALVGVDWNLKSWQEWLRVILLLFLPICSGYYCLYVYYKRTLVGIRS